MTARALGPGGAVTIDGYFFTSSSFSQHPGTALFAHELADVIRAAPAASGHARAFPTAERLHSGPRARRRSGSPVHVEYAGFHLVEEAGDLAFVGREQAAGQTQVRAVRLFERAIERVDDPDREDRQEQFFPKELVIERQLNDRGRDEVAAIQRRRLQPLAAEQHRSVAARSFDRALVFFHGALIDDRPHEDVPLAGIADRERLSL